MVEEKTPEAAEADLFPPTATSDSRESFSDAKPFASKDAPWVGAEDKWLEGAPDLPPSPEGRPEDVKKPFSVIPDDDDDLALHTALPAGHSLAPLPPKNTGIGVKIVIASVVLVLAAAGSVIYWMNARFAEREREMAERERQMMAQRASDKEDVIRLERLIAELSAQGGAENAQRVSALQAELKAKQDAGAAADAAQSSGAAPEQLAGSQEGAHRKEDEKSSTAQKTLASAASGKSEATTKPSATEIADNPYAGNGKSAEQPSPAQKSGSDDDLLDRALSGSYSSTDRANKNPGIPLGGTTLPESPSRAQVKTAMDAVAPQVQKCGPGSGRVVLSVTVAGPTGRVVNAEPTGEAVGTPHGLCAARAVKLAKFPPFQQARLNIKYPFDL
jgi:hypothetical protein